MVLVSTPARRRCTAHFLEGQPRLNQLESARVPQPMGTATCPRPLCARHPRGHHVIESPCRERPKGRAHRQEEGRLFARRPSVTEIAVDRVLDAGFERQEGPMPALGPDDAETVGGPVDIVHPKPTNLARPQAIDGRQSPHRSVEALQRGLAVAVGVSDHRFTVSHVGPIGRLSSR